MTYMNWKVRGLAALAVTAFAGAASAEVAMRFDTVDAKAKAPVSLFNSIREAAKDAVLPAVVATKEAKPAAAAKAVDPKASLRLPPGVKEDPAFWGSDGRWCPDGQDYRGGPCDNTWGGGRDPYYRDPYYRGPSRDPYDDPNWYRRDPYYRDPYFYSSNFPLALKSKN